jgi:PTH1 family peptidyl-tRNA hydrolase
LGTADYWRLRIGVGHPGDKAEVVSWVLKKPMLEHRKAIDESIHRSVTALPLLLNGEMEKAMALIHTSKPPRPKPPRPAKAPDAEPPANS